MTSEYRIETQRLLLRPLSEGDLEAWADFLGNPEATPYCTHLTPSMTPIGS